MYCRRTRSDGPVDTLDKAVAELQLFLDPIFASDFGGADVLASDRPPFPLPLT